MAVRSLLLPLVASTLICPARANQSQELALQLANPLASLDVLSFESRAERNVGPDRSQSRDTLALRVLNSFEATRDWNVSSRLSIPYVFEGPMQSRQSGFADVIESCLLSPARPGADGSSWGLGGVLRVPGQVPFASGEWAMGPSAALVQRAGSATSGILLGHAWALSRSGAVPSDLSMLESFVGWTRNGHTLRLDLDATYDSRTAVMQVPLDVEVSRTVGLGSRGIAVAAGLRYYIDVPHAGDSWGVKLAIALLQPRKSQR